MAIFPKEITQQTSESHFVEHHSKTKIIYMIIIFMIIGAISIMPFVKTDISTQSRGIITTMQENNEIYSAKYGKLKKVNITENQTVFKGDTLIILHAEQLDEEICHMNDQIKQNNIYINELNKLLNGGTEFNTSLYRRRFFEYQGIFNKFKKETEQAQKAFERNKQLYKQQVIAKAKFENKKYNYEMAKYELLSYR